MKEAAAETTRADVDVIRMKTAVVILNWNTEGFLKEFLPPLLRSVSKVDGAEVIVADNASTDGSMELMRKDFPDVMTLQFDRNLGFTGGYNRAFREISVHYGRPEYFLLINSDIEVTDGWLEPLVEWMDAHPGCGCCAPKLHSWQEKDRFEYAGAAGGYLDRFGYPFCRGRIMKRIETDHGQYDTEADVFWATGACLLVRSSVYEELNGLDERFFAHMEEIDLCWRMQLNGYKVTVIPQSVVYHVGGGTLPTTSPFKLQLNYRNNLLMLENNLAKTLSLEHYRNGASADKAASKGIRQARRIIFCRKCLDRMSAMVYLFTFRIADFRAVCKAYREFRKLRMKPTAGHIREYLSEYGTRSEITGLYGRWIILDSLMYGDKVFEKTRKHI